MAWRILPFGKYKGKTLPQIVFADPDWFFWVVAVGFKSGALAVEAEKIRHRATHIRIPGKAHPVASGVINILYVIGGLFVARPSSVLKAA